MIMMQDSREHTVLVQKLSAAGMHCSMDSVI